MGKSPRMHEKEKASRAPALITLRFLTVGAVGVSIIISHHAFPAMMDYTLQL